ncbi:MAG: ATP-binding cassette domain-containing protein, partial [Acidobacteriota bacterium]
MTDSDERPLLQVRGLAKSYGPNHVLRGVDFDLARGETLVILGGSGSGKSVMLRLVDGLERPDEGEVIFDGVSLDGL